MTLTNGQILQNRYRITSLLGQGGMGAVYQAWDTRLNVSLAIKEMVPQPGLDAPTLHQLRHQFQQEAQILARLNHPHLVRVTDYFEESNNVYLVMDFVEGESLNERIRREGALPEPQVLEWTHQLLDALTYCHNQGIIHRDIKPQNVIIRSDGRAVLVDFGLVKLWDPNDPHTRTVMRGMGTPEYAPPEQYDTHVGHTDPRSDIYGLGATIYHALTGHAPPTATMRIASPDVFNPPQTFNPSISPTTEACILKATELAVSNRFNTPEDMAAALKGEKPVAAIAPSGQTKRIHAKARVIPGAQPIPRPEPKEKRETSRRIPAWVWVLGGVASLILVVGVIIATGLIPLPGSTPHVDPTSPAAVAAETSNTSTPTTAPAPTETDTSTDEPTDTPTNTPGSIRTPTPSPKPTSTPKGGGDASDANDDSETPSPSPSPSPTSDRTPTPSPTPGTPSPTPTPRDEPPAPSGALIDFETFGSWRRGDQPYGTLTQSQEQARTGRYAAKLAYDFPASSDDYVVFLRSISLSGTPNSVGAWVYGDGSGHFFNVWFQDAQNQVWSAHLGKVNHTGWRQMVGYLSPNQPWPSGHISGPDNGAVDYPVRFHAIVLDRQSGSQRGQIYIDDITVWQGDVGPTPTPAGPGPVTPTPGETTPTSPPQPVGDVGRIFYTIEAGSAYHLATTDPGWTQGRIIGPTSASLGTCSGQGAAKTLEGQSYNISYGYRCAMSFPKDCPAPDGVYKVMLWSEAGDYSLTVQRIADNSLVHSVYNGPINSQVPLLWAPDSAYFYFAIRQTLHRANTTGGGYNPVLPQAYDPYLSPDGSMIVYMQPVGTVGAYDVWLANADGSNARNVTNAPDTYKLCPRWGR
jgi:eukaryotic-like serine/threonine-protein kinase